MLLHILGKEYVIWDKSASIEYIKSSRGTVTAEFKINDDQVGEVIEHTSGGQKYFPEFSVAIENEARETVARVVKTLYVRKKASRE